MISKSTQRDLPGDIFQQNPVLSLALSHLFLLHSGEQGSVAADRGLRKAGKMTCPNSYNGLTDLLSI